MGEDGVPLDYELSREAQIEIVSDAISKGVYNFGITGPEGPNGAVIFARGSDSPVTAEEVVEQLATAAVDALEWARGTMPPEEADHEPEPGAAVQVSDGT